MAPVPPLLRRLIREAIVVEKAATVGSAAGEGLALYVISSGSDIRMMLYSPKIALQWTDLAIGEEKGDLDDDILASAFEHALLGLIIIAPPPNDCNGAWEVKNSVANKGYGPLLYDIAMAAAPSRAIMSDRNKVSKTATGVWQHYFSSRGDVAHRKLDDEDHPKTPDPSDDCPVHGDARAWLDYSYEAKGAVDPQRLVGNHLRFMREMPKKLAPYGHWTPDTVATVLEQFAEDMFARRYAAGEAYDPFPSR